MLNAEQTSVKRKLMQLKQIYCKLQCWNQHFFIHFPFHFNHDSRNNKALVNFRLCSVVFNSTIQRCLHFLEAHFDSHHISLGTYLS